MEEENMIPEIHSDEVNDIIGRTPSWLLRRGNIVIGCILVMLAVGAGLLRYPDTISAPFLISSEIPPVKLVAQASGKVTALFAKDGDTVQANKIIAVIENPANTNDMLTLKKIVEVIDTTLDMKRTIASLKLPAALEVGELQADYSVLYQAIGNYDFFVGNGYYSRQLSTIGNEEKNNDEIEKTIRARQAMLADQLKGEAWKDSINREMLKDKIISESEYNDIKKGYLSQNITTQDNLNTLLQNRQQRRELQKSRSDIQQQYRMAGNEALLALKTAAKKILGQISVWERQYVLEAPSPGKLVFFSVRTSNQYVTAGSSVFMVVPVSQQYEIHVKLPLYKAGKVKKGELVLLKLTEFPYEEYGMLRAKVSGITNVAIDSAYSVDLQLENGLISTRNRTIELRPEISGIADIITNDKNVLQRIFESIYGKLNER